MGIQCCSLKAVCQVECSRFARDNLRRDQALSLDFARLDNSTNNFSVVKETSNCETIFFKKINIIYT
jgi:hypothetical protein